MNINKLYGVLCAGCAVDTGTYYYKTSTNATVPQGCQPMVAALIGTGTDQEIRYKACIICRLATVSIFQQQIMQLDGKNSYSLPAHEKGTSRPVAVPACSTMATVLPLMDHDIRDRLASTSPIDYIGAIALHILRRVG